MEKRSCSSRVWRIMQANSPTHEFDEEPCCDHVTAMVLGKQDKFTASSFDSEIPCFALKKIYQSSRDQSYRGASRLN